MKTKVIKFKLTEKLCVIKIIINMMYVFLCLLSVGLVLKDPGRILFERVPTPILQNLFIIFKLNKF
jgi:hypothetical protein